MRGLTYQFELSSPQTLSVILVKSTTWILGNLNIFQFDMFTDA